MEEARDLNLEIFNCNKCEEASKYRAYPMPGFYGKYCHNNVAIIAQNPGLPNATQKSKAWKFEEIDDDYLIGLANSPVGEFLLQLLPFDLDYALYTNVVKCAFPSRYKIDKELPICHEYLKKQLEIVDPRIIICIGAPALSYFLPEANLTKASLTSTVVGRGIVIPVFHPSYLNRMSEEEKVTYLKKANSALASLVEDIGLEK